MSKVAAYDFYLSSTFKNAWNVEFNHRIGPLLESQGLKGYLPHRDTLQKESPDKIFAQDIDGIEHSRKILAVALNETPNWGAEIGFAYAKQIPVVALTNRVHEIPLILNGMVTQIIRVDDLDALETYLDRLVLALR